MVYRAFLTDVLTGRKLVHDLPIAVREYTWPLGGIPTLTGVVSLDTPGVPRIEEGRTALWLDDGGSLLWGGIVWNAVPDIAARTLSVSAGGFMSYLAHREIRRTLKYAAVEQLEIARTLLAYVQREPSGRIGLGVEEWTGSKLRDRTYPGDARKKVWEAFSQLSDVEGGFDFFEDWYYDDAGRPRAIVRFIDADANPGRVLRDVRFVYDDRAEGAVSNLTNYTWPTVGPDRVNDLVVSGAGEGDAKLVAQVVDEASIAAGWPQLDGSEMYPDVSVAATLYEHAWEDLRARSGNVALSEVTLGGDGPRPGRDFKPGDLAQFRFTSAYHRASSPQGSGWSGWMRFNNLKVSPEHATQAWQVTATVEHTTEDTDG